MNNLSAASTPLRRQFIEYLTLHRKAERTVHAYVSFIADLARFHQRRPDLLGPPELERWLAHLIGERKRSASSVNIAVNALRSFYGGFLQRDLAALLRGVQCPRRPVRMPRPYSLGEVERLLRVDGAGRVRRRGTLPAVPILTRPLDSS